MKIAGIIAIAVEAAAIAALSFALSFSMQRGNDIRERCKEQSEVIVKQQATIDSLLRKRDTFIDVELNVTDKSRATIYGRYNKGTITIPQQRTYILEIDSTNVKIK